MKKVTLIFGAVKWALKTVFHVFSENTAVFEKIVSL